MYTDEWSHSEEWTTKLRTYQKESQALCLEELETEKAGKFRIDHKVLESLKKGIY